jgi:hypothetical protein
MKLTKFGMSFKGPYSAELFKQAYIEPEGFDHVVIGTGESKAIASARAFAHLRGNGINPIMDDISSMIDKNLPSAPHTVEGDDKCSVYCIIGASVE